ncbi:MAG: cob(I)yrinic acid a,c-diamide adenosyltransferase [Deltaproteobacteria bacterium]|nr:cob(I)yrinic acid a,c-diamide adenosyltransferase [Deltaproteobacteria bacterium]
MSIYTKRGDDGTTGLIGGTRRAKDDVRIEAYGTVDELSSAVGAALAEGQDALVDRVLRVVQCDLFALSARLASPGKVPEGARLEERREAELEATIDEVDRHVPALQGFIRPGGCRAAAALHMARTICRRAERRVVALHRAETVDPFHLRYLNRLADALFSLARYANWKAGVPDEPLTGSGCGE